MNLIKPDYSNLKTLVLNLDDYKENYNKQLPYLESIGLKVQRFSGINATKDEHLKPEYKQHISNFALNFTPKSIIGGSVSHILCSKYIYDNILDKFEYFFSEDQGRYIVEVKKENVEKVKKILEKNSNHYDLIGEVIGDNISINDEPTSSVDKLTEFNKDWLNKYMIN